MPELPDVEVYLEKLRPRVVGAVIEKVDVRSPFVAVSYTHLRAHETVLDLVCRLLLEKKKKNIYDDHHKYNTPL